MTAAWAKRSLLASFRDAARCAFPRAPSCYATATTFATLSSGRVKIAIPQGGLDSIFREGKAGGETQEPQKRAGLRFAPLQFNDQHVIESGETAGSCPH